MRVAIFNNYLNTRGGGEKLTLEYAEYFASRHPEGCVEILSFYESVPDAGEYAKYFGLKLPRNVKIVSLSQRLGRVIRILIKIRPFFLFVQTYILRRFYADYDLFLNQTAASLCGAVARRNIYIMMFPFAGNSGMFFKDLVGKFWSIWILRKYQSILAISEFTRRIAVSTYGVEEKTATVYPCFEGISTRVQRKKNRQNKLSILSIARFCDIGHRKRQDLLIKAFDILTKKLNGIELHLIGSLNVDSPGDLAYFNRLKEYARIRGLRVRFTENATIADKVAALGEANIFWLGTGLHEGEGCLDIAKEHFGIVVLEAMSNGIVPFTYHEGGVVELYEDGLSGFRCASVESLAAKTFMFANFSDSGKNKISSAARSYVKRFGKNIFQNNLDQILKAR